MRIPSEISKISAIYGAQKKAGRVSKTGSVASKKDVLSISTEAKDYQTAYRALKDVPDVRTGKVAEILEKFESGRYNVSGRDVASKVISKVFDKKV
jgi:negative regulator of flagellin synthesis FlgM